MEKAEKMSLDLGANNSVTYDISKTGTISFSQASHQKLANQLVEKKLRFRGEKIYF